MTKKEQAKLDRYYRKYGITYEQYQRLSYNGCWICHKVPGKGQRRLAVDHNHKTGETRGVLCFYCNKFRVGKLTTEWAYLVWEYLRSFDA